jgi:hypothetical protein
MTGPGVGNSNTDIEQGLLELFRRELRHAVDDVVGSPDDNLDSIRTQKLVLSGIRAFGLEDQVTIQWYLDGDMLPHLPEDGDGMTIVTNAGIEDGPFPSQDDVYEFYTDGLVDSIPTGETISEVLEPDAFDWLHDYYEAYEVPFSDVYQTNLEIYLRLRHFQNYLDPDHPRNELTENVTPSTMPATISAAATRMKQTLIEHPLFQNTPPYITEFDRVANQILTRISEDIETDDEGDDYHILVSHLGRFYYQAIWQPIADRIGYYTVSAPSEDKVERTREFRTQNLRSAQTIFFHELNELRGRAKDFDIRFNIRTERLPRFAPDETGLADVLSVDMRVPEGP